MIQMEYPKLPLDGLTPEEQVAALKRQVDILTDNLQIVLNSIEADVGNVDNTSDKDKPISDAVQEALDTKVDKVTGKGLSTNDYTTTAKDKVDGIEAYVVESGTSNGWNYKRYSDGTIDAWYRGSKSLSHYNTINGFYAFGYNAIDLPFTMANATYQCDADFLIGNGFTFGTSVRKSTTQLTNLFALSTASGTQTVYLNAYIHGTLA